MRPLAGKVALVTGAGQRLGRAIAEGLGALGADVAVHFNASREGAEAAAARLRVDGNRAQLFQADLSRADALEPLVAAVEQALGPIAVLVNSAALYERHDFLDTPPEALERQWALNVRAPFLLTQAVARRMKPRGGGDVVNVLDIGGSFNVWRHYSAYTMTKAALTHLTRSLAVELAPHIRVNGVAPGTVLPPDDLSPEVREALRAKIPFGAFGSPSDVVAAVQFFVSGPRFITGQILSVDGGRYLAGG
jgi:pteridine reductase